MDMLSDPEARRPGFGMELPFDLPFRVAAKTGTARGFANTWAIAATREVIAGAWAGTFDGRSTQGIVGMDAAAPLVRDAPARRRRRPAAHPAAAPRRHRAGRALRDLGHGARPALPARPRPRRPRPRAGRPCSWHDDAGRLHYPDRARPWLARRR